MQAEINRNARFDLTSFTADERPSLASLRAVLAESRIDLPAELPPMAAGLFGFMTYDMIRLFEPTVPAANPDPLGIFDSVFLRPTLVAVFDNIKDSLTIVTPVYPDPTLGCRSGL